MLSKVIEDPTRSALSVYEEVRNSFTQNMESENKLLFLSTFPTYREIQFQMYKERRKLIPPNPKTMTDLNVEEEVAGEGGDVDEEGEEDSLKICYKHSLILSPWLGPGGCLALSPPRRLMSAVWRKFKGINSM